MSLYRATTYGVGAGNLRAMERARKEDVIVAPDGSKVPRVSPEGATALLDWVNVCRDKNLESLQVAAEAQRDGAGESTVRMLKLVADRWLLDEGQCLIALAGVASAVNRPCGRIVTSSGRVYQGCTEWAAAGRYMMDEARAGMQDNAPLTPETKDAPVQVIDAQTGEETEVTQESWWRRWLGRHPAAQVDQFIGTIVAFGCRALTPHNPSALCRWALAQVTEVRMSEYTQWLYSSLRPYAEGILESYAQYEADMAACKTKGGDVAKCLQDAEDRYLARNRRISDQHGGGLPDGLLPATGGLLLLGLAGLAVYGYVITR